MKETIVSATYTKKVQVVQYEPAEVSCTLSESCPSNKRKETYEALYNECKENVVARIKLEERTTTIKKDVKAKVVDNFEPDIPETPETFNEDGLVIRLPDNEETDTETA